MSCFLLDKGELAGNQNKGDERSAWRHEKKKWNPESEKDIKHEDLGQQHLHTD